MKQELGGECAIQPATSTGASLAKETVVGRAAPTVQKGAGGYADGVMVTILI